MSPAVTASSPVLSRQALACLALYTAGAGFCLLARALVVVDQRSPAAALGASLEPAAGPGRLGAGPGVPTAGPAAFPARAEPGEAPVGRSSLTLEARFKR